MDYQDALIAAGATVLAYESFGSYSGDWWAKVDYEAKQFWVHGYFGSCSGCDALQAEFTWGLKDTCDAHEYVYDEKVINACADCQAQNAANYVKLGELGKTYLVDDVHDQDSAEKKAAENCVWDQESSKMLEFLRNNPLQGA